MSDTSLDVTADVVEATVVERPFGGRMRLVLRNDGGLYSGPPSPVRPGAEVRISPGYRTASGPLVSDGPAFWIDRIEYGTGNGESFLVLEGRDAWALLEGWQARRQYTWAAGAQNVFGILQWLFARAGLEFSSSGASASASNLYPAFTLNPGESGLTAARRLLDKLPDAIFLRGEFAYLTEPLASETADYAYGTDHRIIAGRYGDTAAEANRAQVYGKAVFGERFDWPAAAETHDRLVHVLDANLTTVAQVEARADALLRRSALETADGEIAVPVNCGQELYDAIDVTDTLAGLASSKRRVLALALRYSAERGVYEQRIGLGAP